MTVALTTRVEQFTVDCVYTVADKMRPATASA